MSHKLQFIILLALAVYFCILFYLLKKRRLNIKYTLLWIFSGFLMLVLTIFPGLITFFSKLVGIIEPTNALFAALLFCMIIILMSLTAVISKMNEQIKRLTQTIAMLEKRLRELEERANTGSETLGTI